MLKYNKSTHSFTFHFFNIKPILLPFHFQGASVHPTQLFHSALHMNRYCPALALWNPTAARGSGGFAADPANRVPAFSLGVPEHMANNSPAFTGEQAPKPRLCLTSCLGTRWHFSSHQPPAPLESLLAAPLRQGLWGRICSSCRRL